MAKSTIRGVDAGPLSEAAVADYLQRERREVEQIGEYLTEHAPFRKGT